MQRDSSVRFEQLVALKRARGGSAELARLRLLLFEILEGSVGAPGRAAAWADASPALRLATARLLRDLSFSEEALVLLSAIEPTAYPQAEALDRVFALLLTIPASRLGLHRAWLSRLVTSASSVERPVAVAPFIRKLDEHGYFEVADALRATEAGRLLSPADCALVDATRALWAGRYSEVTARLAAVVFEGGDRVEADLLTTIARAVESPTPDDVSQLDSIIGALAGRERLREVAERWRVEFLLRLQRYEDAETVSDHPVQRLLQRMLQLQHRIEGRQEVDDNLHEPLIDRLRAMSLASNGEDPQERRLWELVKVFGGNRTNTCTVLVGGVLRVVELPTARQEVVLVQAELPRRGLSWAHAEFARLTAQHPTVAVYETYQAEVLLWEGRYHEALVIFERTWRSSKNRWAYIGRGAALAALGRDDEACAVWDEGVRYHQRALPGEASFTYRAEVAMRRGDLDEAERWLRPATEGRPTRLRAWMLRAELSFVRGESAEARAALEQAVLLCPGLFTSDIADWELVEALLSGGGATVSQEQALMLCRSVRARSLANASSWLYTWIDRAGHFRAFKKPRDWGSVLQLSAYAPTSVHPPPDVSRRLVLRHSASQITVELDVRHTEAGRRAYATVGPLALSYRSTDNARTYGQAEVRALLAVAEAALRRSVAQGATLVAATRAIAEAAFPLGWANLEPS